MPELSDSEFLNDLAERLMHVPQRKFKPYCERLRQIADKLDDTPLNLGGTFLGEGLSYETELFLRWAVKHVNTLDEATDWHDAIDFGEFAKVVKIDDHSEPWDTTYKKVGVDLGQLLTKYGPKYDLDKLLKGEG